MKKLISCSESQCQLLGSLHPKKMGNSAQATTDRVNFISKCCQVVADTGWSISIFSDRTKNFIKCILLMFLESLYKCRFWCLDWMFPKSQVVRISPVGAVLIYNICCTMQRLNKQIHSQTHQQQTPTNAIRSQHELQAQHIFKHPFWVSGDVCWCRLLSVGVPCCPQLSCDTRKRRLRAY